MMAWMDGMGEECQTCDTLNRKAFSWEKQVIQAIGSTTILQVTIHCPGAIEKKKHFPFQ